MSKQPPDFHERSQQSHERAFKRLQKAGSTSAANVRRRLAVIADERLIPTADVLKALRSDRATLDFCVEHAISTDWVFYGDLKGLLRTVRDARSTTPEATLAQSQEVATLFGQLTPHDRNRLLNGLRNMTGAAPKRGPAA
ncbi:hypothetical protein [Bradyrhizobium australafricanum]|uniref:hypothetical protein n=1 Tax=Bradyrhizobium australafricanum TaxID=2821406 RepID=UPI001CE38DE5|nr:hypothetical protein [Bradyrhizobium australafricanum]MCA6105105.1 hypothetical protein [Bradyrhizobium australafricanum]